MRDFATDHRWMSLNTATVRKQWPLAKIIDECARRDIRAISPWRDQVAQAGLQATAAQLRAHSMSLSGYCRGGMFPAADTAGRLAARDDNRRAADEAMTLAAPCLVLVVGGLPGALNGKPTNKDIAGARQQVHDGIAELLDYTRPLGLPLAIEPLHPMYAADRACVNTLRQALDLCEALDPRASSDGSTPAASSPVCALGVAVDTYHVWWDPELEAQIARAARQQRLLAHHVCDWLVPTVDLLNDRGMMGDGVIDLPRIRGWLEAGGFAGFCEVEIFSDRWWSLPGEQVLDTCIERMCTVV